MESRRKFLKASAAALTVAATRPIFGIQGANDRIRVAVIGCGNRSGRVFDSFARQANVQWVAGAEVNRAKLEGTGNQPGFMTPARQTFKLDIVEDYRRILDRKDIDAVLIGTPDHWHHQQTIDAISAGKDVYVEKPAANTVPRLNAMLDAYREGKQVVQVGTQQRSWDHFMEAKKILDSGVLGNITHIYIVQPGSYARPAEPVQPVPEGLNWDLWQGPAERRPFKPSRLGFRAWYEYGGGLVADWGAHHVDVAHWFMNADTKIPVKTAANGAFLTVPDADPEQVPDTFSISWQYDNFIMTFANGEVPRAQEDLEGWGVFFVGPQRGSLQVNRMGWALRPTVPRTIRKQGAPPPPTAGGMTLGGGAPAAQPGAPGGPGGRGAAGGRGAGGRGGGRGGADLPPIEYKVYLNPRGGVEEDYPLDAHVQNFLECMKTRQKPASDMEIGYYAALPCLLALEAIQKNKTLGWDAQGRTSKAL
jgi:predicted dehydrogenase